ncbi:MAG TPA: YciI family protein [Leptospiraceae bacterium]|nr:YciI family protein [Leptospiraceae bacterium]HMW07092.1 YciI family protein [Leptospiraceae bacterium]HMX31766.1 YciI family protein [Leptospiraceae bacterium]HMY32591.1 YciI family protein [Leptospiraceae bacterium]HMZ63875.1 YciI family protein [Leptospiraceae bacterium]
MKHFIIRLDYKVPIEKIDTVLVEHRAFLDSGYEKKILLSSGPQNPRDGGILIARAESLEAIREFCSKDPFAKNNFADYHFTEFIPVKFQKEFESWFLAE